MLEPWGTTMDDIRNLWEEVWGRVDISDCSEHRNVKLRFRWCLSVLLSGVLFTFCTVSTALLPKRFMNDFFFVRNPVSSVSWALSDTFCLTKVTIFS